MIARSVQVKLLAFLLITLLAVSVLSARYVGLYDRVAGGQYRVSADFAESGGIFVGSEVTYRGVTVGRVERLRLSDDGVIVDARLRRGTQIPRDTVAVVENRSAVGEQYLDFQPRSGRGPMLRDGDVVPRADTRTPLRIDTFLLDMDQTVRSVDRRDLQVVVDELGQAFGEGGTDLQRLLDSGDALTRAATRALPETVRLIDDGRIVLDTQRASAKDITAFSANFADLAETLEASDADLRLILDRGAVASRELEGLITDNEDALATLLANFVTIGRVTTARLDGIEQLLVTYPDVVAGGYTVVPGDGTAHFGLSMAHDPEVCTQGYEGTTWTDPHRTTNLPPVNRGARCTLPRGSASTVRGAQNAPGPSSRSSSQAANASFPLAYAGQPVPLGNRTVAGLQAARVATPLPPEGAGGVDTWLWMMRHAAR
jgi:phospholipid/cholesterol/gamma-HCH transport system substrate-binding protein